MSEPEAKTSKKKWSARVTKYSNALDLEKGVFLKKDPLEIARSLKRSAQQSRRRRSALYQSAMSMLNFYINRAGRGLGRRQEKVLQEAKIRLREIFNRTK